MQRAPQRLRIPKRHRQDTETWRRRTEALQRLQARVRQGFQDAERMYHAVEEQWQKRRHAPTAQSIHA